MSEKISDFPIVLVTTEKKDCVVREDVSLSETLICQGNKSLIQKTLTDFITDFLNKPYEPHLK